jgi:hypothetical protein
MVSEGDRFHVDLLDLYAARARESFHRLASQALSVPEAVISKEVGRVLLKLEQIQEENIQCLITATRPAPVEMSDKERDEALALLRDPRLVDRILEDCDRVGIVGERMNKLVGYLAAVSRKCDEPLAVVVQSGSAAGKSTLIEAVLGFVPPEDRVSFSSLTAQAMYYLPAGGLRHKVLSVAEEEGSRRVSYALKILQSEKRISIAAAERDPTGRQVTREHVVEGPTAVFTSTTSIDIDDELLGRYLVLTVDEDRKQTRAIHQHQRDGETLAGLLAKQDRERILRLHQSAQRLLRPLAVANPYAPHLTFLDDRTRARRDHTKYLALIRTVALLHQHQREVRTAEHAGKQVQYVEATIDDIEAASRIAHEVLGHSLDELPAHTRKLLLALHAMALGSGTDRRDFRFTRRQVREATGLGDTQAWTHLRRLVEMEYVIAHRTERGLAYELIYDGQGQDGRPFLPGLVDVAAIRSGSIRRPSGPDSPPIRPGASEHITSNGARLPPKPAAAGPNEVKGPIIDMGARTGEVGL